MTREEQLQNLQFRAEGLLRQHKASRELHCKIEGNRASEMSAEYLVRHVPDWQAHEDAADMACNPSHTTPLETLAGFAVLALMAIIFGVIL